MAKLSQAFLSKPMQKLGRKCGKGEGGGLRGGGVVEPEAGVMGDKERGSVEVCSLGVKAGGPGSRG